MFECKTKSVLAASLLGVALFASASSVSAAVIPLTVGGADVEGNGASQNIAGGWSAVAGTGDFVVKGNGFGNVLHSGPTRLRQNGVGGPLTAEVEQAIDISAHAADIDAGNVTTSFSSWGFSSAVDDGGHMLLQFLDASNAVIGSSATVAIEDGSGVWKELVLTDVVVPTLTRKINVIGGVHRLAGSSTDGMWDGDVTGSLATVPEPASMALVALGLTVIAGGRRSR